MVRIISITGYRAPNTLVGKGHYPFRELLYKHFLNRAQRTGQHYLGMLSKYLSSFKWVWQVRQKRLSYSLHTLFFLLALQPVVGLYFAAL
jgi:hypothetical protein